MDFPRHGLDVSDRLLKIASVCAGLIVGFAALYMLFGLLR